MRTLRFVAPRPLLVDDLYFPESVERLAIGLFAAPSADEGFAVAMLAESVGRHEQPLRVQAAQSVTLDVRCHLRAVVRALMRRETKFDFYGR